jgi:hypothetical protein
MLIRLLKQEPESREIGVPKRVMGLCKAPHPLQEPALVLTALRKVVAFVLLSSLKEVHTIVLEAALQILVTYPLLTIISGFFCFYHNLLGNVDPLSLPRL